MASTGIAMAGDVSATLEHTPAGLDSAREAEVLAQCRNGDWHAYGQLVERYQRLVRAAVDFGQDEQELADLIQESFIRAFEKLQLYRGQGSYSSWLYRVARNLALNRRRSLGRGLRGTADSSALSAVQTGETPPATVYLREQRQRMLRTLIADLPPQQHEPLARHYFLGQSYEQIAAALGLPLNTVRTHIHRAKLRLRNGAQKAGWALGDLDD
jgi:RNA polymerase sigma factor (sigma-70 family)